MAADDRQRAEACIDSNWLRHLGINNKTFTYYPLRPETEVRTNKAASNQAPPLSFLEQINRTGLHKRSSDSTSPEPPQSFKLGDDGTSKFTFVRPFGS